VKIKRFCIVVLIALFFISFNWDNYKFYKLNGRTLSYNQLTNASSCTVLFLWTSMCPYCRSEFKRINKDLESFGSIQLYYVNLGESKRTVRKAAQLLKLSAKIKKNIVLDRLGLLVDEFNIIGVPTYIFVKDGKVVYKTHFITKKLIKDICGDKDEQ